ncbi:MAG: amidohydrolase, partial [Phaeodactylibacter sp.]|nr:amidohydrolase [Phaeodactylibacter sp.]
PLAGKTDLIVLPEMFTTGFSMRSEDLAEPMDGPTVRWMQDQAEKLGAVLCGSFIAEERALYYNRLVWMRPDGQYFTYDKRHLFTLADEQDYFTPGSERLLVEWKGWTICPLICYDLRFPVWSRNNGNIDLLLYVANWPSKRRHAWKTLLRARAIENQCYTVGVNRIGTDANEHPYAGDSSCIDFAGEILYQAAQVEQVCQMELSHDAQESFRARFPFLRDADRFTIHVD